MHGSISATSSGNRRDAGDGGGGLSGRSGGVRRPMRVLYRDVDGLNPDSAGARDAHRRLSPLGGLRYSV